MFRALRHRNYRLWFIGQIISTTGMWMQSMAQQVLVYRLTGSAASLGIVNFVALIPLIPLSFWGGSLIDRFPKRKVVLVAQILQLLQAVVLGILAWTGTVEVWHVYALSFFMGAVSAVDLPARQAFTIDLVEGKEDLASAIGLNSAQFNAARAIGPAAAGVVVAAIGEGPAFIANAATYLAVVAALLMMRDLPEPEAGEVRYAGLEHMLEGAHFILSRSSLLMVIILVCVSSVFAMGYGTLLPVFATDILAESASPVVAAVCEGPNRVMNCLAPEALPLGMLLASVGLGAVIGALSVASLPNEARRGVWLTIGSLAFPFFLIFAAISRSFLFTMTIMPLVGLSFVWQNALVNTIVQMMTPDGVRGRVMAVYSMVTMATMRMGSLLAGYVADWITAPWAQGIGAAISLAFGLYVAIFRRDVRKL